MSSQNQVAQQSLYSQLFSMPVAVAEDRQLGVPFDQMQIVPSHKQLVHLPSQPLQQRFTRTMQVSSQAGLALRFLGYGALFEGTRIYPAGDFDWALMSLGEDPLYAFHNQRLPVPKRVKQDLTQIQGAGVHMDHIYIAHQIPAGRVQPGQPVPLHLVLPAPPEPTQKRLSSLSAAVNGLWGLVGTAARAPLAIGAAMASGVAFDPVLLGVQIDENWRKDGQLLATWYYLTHWFWQLAGESK